MRCILLALTLVTLGGPAMADPFDVHRTARAIFADLPSVMQVDDMTQVCGGGAQTNPDIAYCTSDNVIFHSADFASHPQASYEMAHVLGHAIQVQHGVADVALRAIRTRPDEERALRGMVTGQVDCVAGVLMSRTSLPFTPLTDLFNSEPFTQAHWGRNPLNRGPRVSIGLAARADWFEAGYKMADFGVCSVGEMSADLIVQAQR